MDRMPPEILQDIFLLAVVRSSWLSLEVRRLYHTSVIEPLRISHVCRTWRNLSISDGRMWSYLCVDRLSFGRKRWESVREVFDTWIARSGNAPLNYGVFFDLKRQIPDQNGPELAVHIVTTLIENQHRWGDVNFVWTCDHAGWPSDVQGFDTTSMPMLTSLRLLCKRQRHITINFDRSPQLRKVNIQGDFSISASEESLRHLKEPSRLVFRDGYKSEDAIRSCQNFLSIAPFLEEIRLEFEDGLSLPISPLNDHRPIYHGLRLLNLSYWLGSEVFIDNVTLPSLRSLRYDCSSLDGGDKLRHFLERSLPPLTYLNVSGLRTFKDTFIPCLRFLPNLKKLAVADVTVSTRFFHELSVPDSGTGIIVCPSLGSLSFHNLGCSDDSDACVEALISMLESRARIVASFRNVWFRAVKDWSSTTETSRLRDYDQETKEWLLKELTVGKIRTTPFSDI